MEYIAQHEASYLAALVSGEQPASFWSDNERTRLIAKLLRLKDWADREDAARERLLAL